MLVYQWFSPVVRLRWAQRRRGGRGADGGAAHRFRRAERAAAGGGAAAKVSLAEKNGTGHRDENGVPG